MEVARRSFQAAVSQQDLDGAQIRARLQQMGSEAVAKRMWADLLGDSSSADGIPKNREDGVITDRFVGSFAGEEPFLSLTSTVFCQFRDRLRRKSFVCNKSWG